MSIALWEFRDDSSLARRNFQSTERSRHKKLAPLIRAIAEVQAIYHRNTLEREINSNPGDFTKEVTLTLVIKLKYLEGKKRKRQL